MFGQMTAGSWIYIGTQGILQGTYQTFAAAGEQHFGSPDLTGPHDPDRRPRRDGRGAAARGDDGGRGDPVRRGRPEPDRAAPRDALPRRGRRLARRRARLGCARLRAEGRALSVGLLGERGRRLPGAGCARRALRPRHRPDGRARPAHGLRARRGAVRGGRRRCARRDPESIPAPCARVDRRARTRDDSSSRARAATCSTTATTCEGRRTTRGSRTRSRIRASSPRTSGRCSAGGSGRSAGRCSRAIRRTSTRSTASSRALFPDDALLQRWLELAPGRVAFQGLAGADLLARVRRSGAGGACDQRARPLGRGVGAGRHRPRPPRRRARSPRRTARPRRCATAPTRSPTGRS